VARAHLARPTDAPSAAHESMLDPDTGTVPEIPAGEVPLLPPEELPRHVAIIMDGNRRWARLRDCPSSTATRPAWRRSVRCSVMRSGAVSGS
jgi:Undecaprenyl pyrophosphate synthase